MTKKMAAELSNRLVKNGQENLKMTISLKEMPFYPKLNIQVLFSTENLKATEK
jgi:hypothetical protein